MDPSGCYLPALFGDVFLPILPAQFNPQLQKESDKNIM